jgi:hypothetical protein
MGGNENPRSPRNPYRPPNAPIGPAAKDPGGTPGRAGSSGGFSVECACGRTIPIGASQAGSITRCECNADVRVPSLGRLRESVGRDRYESSISDTIHRMIQSGALPSRDTCAITRKPTEDVIELDIVMPRFFKTNENADKIAILFIGLLGALLLAAIRRPKFQEEGALTIRVPILVARRYHPKVRRMGQRRLFRLLQTIPIYAELLNENPHSRITIPDLENETT